MFDTTWQHSSSSPLPSQASPETALKLLHDFDTIIHLNPDVRSTKPVKPSNGYHTNKGSFNQYYEVEDDIPFIPKKLWSGGVRYTAIFLPIEGEGCDITISAPGGFTSVNHWRLVKEGTDQSQAEGEASYKIEIVSDAKCSRTFAQFVRKFLVNSHQQLQRGFSEKLKQDARPGMPRRRSSFPLHD